MNTKQLNRIFVRTMYVMVIAVLVFSVTGSALADEPAPPRIYAGLTDDSIRYELTAPYASVTFSIYASEGGDLLSEITKDADETGFVWISIWEHRQELKPGTFIVVGDETQTNKLVVQEVSIDIVNAEENILSGKAPAGSFVWVVANNEPDRCGISIEAASDNTWQSDFDDLGCDISADMVFYAQVMDDEGDTSEANPDFIDGWHDGAEGVGHPNSCNVSGFATDTDDRNRDLEIRVLSDGSQIATTLANGFWDGFIGECGQDGTCGFYVNLWGLEGVSLYQQHEITVQAYDIETEQWQNLGGTPRLLTCANYDLYIFDTKTGKAERLTTNLPDKGEYNPSWSNNGKQIVHDVADANGHELYITDVKTKISMPLEGGDGGNDASWSPNGKWIVFDRRWYDDPNLYLLTPKGGERQLVVENATNGDWSPDSQRLVFERDGGLWTASINGGDEQQIVEAGYGPAWSPDGLWIAYDLDGDIWKIALDEYGAPAGDPIQLTSGPVSEGGATWSQNGAFIVFASDATGDHDIWQIAAEGGIPAQLRGAIGYGDYDPDYSNNGQYIAYEGATEPSVPHIESDTWLNTYALADWPVGQLINVSIDDPATSKQPDYRTSFTPDGTSNWYLFQPGLDIQPGFVITAKSKFFTKTLIVSNLAATDVDAGSGIVSGVATPNNSFYMVADGDHFRLPNGQGVSVDENGNWTADFSGAEAPLPWTWYTGGEMFEWDVDGDMTHSFWHLHQEVIEVWLPYNEIRAFDWPLNTNLKFYVDGEEIATALTEPAVWMNGSWATVNTGDLQLQPGMIVTVTDGVTTKDMIIQDIKITKIDADNDLVYGYGPTDFTLELGSWEDSPVFRFFNTDEDGNWMVDYRTPSVNGVTIDLNPGDDIRLFARDAEKDATVWEAITYPPLYLRVNYGHDWVESFYEAGHEVVITVTNSEGAEKATATVFTEPKDFWGGQAGFQTAPDDWSPAPPDIQPYDWVYARVDNGATAQVQIGDISGALDLNTDSIEGTINAPWFTDAVQVECLDWGSGQEPPFGNKDGGFVPTNGEYPYSCSWYGEWDIQPGQNVGVGYFGPDGHWVANAFYVRPLFLYIHYEYPDVVEGDYELGHTVQVTVFDSEGNTKATATVDTMEMPHWGGAPGFRVEQWDGIEGPPDIQPGDVVQAVVDDGFLTTEARVGEITGLIDLDTNSVTGTINAPWAGDSVNVLCSPWGAPGGASDKETTVVPDGISEFTCTWDSSEWEIQPGETVGVYYWGSAPYTVANAIPNPWIMAFPEANQVFGYGWPVGSDVTLTINDEEIATVTVGGAPWDMNDIMAFFDFWGMHDLVAGDQVTLSGSRMVRTHIVQNLAVTEINVEPDTVSGTADTGAEVHAWIHGIGRDVQINVIDGTWDAYFGGDDFYLQPGMCGRAEIRVEGYNSTNVDWCVPPPSRIVVQITDDWFRAENFTPNGELTFWVYETEGGQLLRHPENTWQLDGSGYVTVGMWELAEYIDLVPGNYLIVSDGVTTKDIVLEAFTFDTFNLSNGQLSGTAPSGRNVWVGIGWQYQDAWTMNVTTDETTGSWLADFGQPVPSDYWWVAAQIFDADGDASELRPDRIVDLWVSAYTYDYGTWSAGDHSYHFETTWTDGSEITNEIFFNVSNEAELYEGFALVRPGAVRAGVDCPPVDAIRPDQLTRFLAGYVTDQVMTYEEAMTFFESLTAEAVWDGSMSAELAPHEIIPFRSDDWFQYVCTFTASFILQANAGWVDSGIDVNVGTPVTITAYGEAATGDLVQFPGAISGPDGQGGLGCGQYEGAPPPCALDDAPYGALVGKIGEDGEPFLIGSNFTFTPTTSGDLYLAVNDNLDYHIDNSGSFLIYLQ